MSAPRVIDGRYRLTEKIGHGGMGQVWAGHDRRLERQVAVKLLRADLLAPSEDEPGRIEELRLRFLRECRISAALDHPGLVTVFDAGQDDGELYLVMQRVPGLSLADLLAEEGGSLPVDRAAAVTAQVCTALAAVHAVPVVHRDLKPSNLMVRPDGRVVLLDLGVATALDPDSTRLTLTGAPIGSPAYMAPEQALAAGVDPRSDLYALGCLLHEMLSGDAPFRAPTALGVLRRHVDEPPVPLRRLRPDVPPQLEALVLDLLAKQPAARPADAAQVYARLLPFVPAPAGLLQPLHGHLPDPTRPFRHPHQPVPTAPVLPSQPVPAAPALPSQTAPPPAVAEEELSAACDRLSDLVAARRYPEVLDLAARLLPRAQAELGPDAPLVATIRTIHARTLEQLGPAAPGTAGSWQALLEVLLDSERRLGPHHPDVLRLRHQLERLTVTRSTPLPGNPYATGS